MATDQPGLAARLEAAAAHLAQLDAAAAGAVETASAASLARTAQDLLAEVLALIPSPDAETWAAQFSSAASSAASQLMQLLNGLSARLSSWRPSGHAADLWLLLSASELLQACAYVAGLGALCQQQQQLSLAQSSCSCFLSCSQTVAASVEAASSGSGSLELGDLAALHSSLLGLAFCVIWTAYQLGANAAELAPPDKLVVCLAAAVQAARRLSKVPAAGRELRMVVPSMARMLHALAVNPAWSAHAQAAAAHAQLASDMLAVMMPYVGTLAVGLRLPEERRPDGCSWETAGWVAGLLNSTVFEEAVGCWARAVDGASTAAVVAAAAQLMQQVPLEQHGPAKHKQHALLLAMLPGHLCAPLCHSAAALARQSREQQRRVAAQLLPAISRLLQLLLWLAQVTLPGSERLALLIPAANFQILLACHYLASSFKEDGVYPRIARSLPDLGAWASAATAALRLLPLLYALQRVGQLEAEAAELPSALVQLLRNERLAAVAAVAADLVRVICELQPQAALLVFRNAPGLLQRNAAGEAAACKALQAVWAHHTAMCRWVHWAAAASSPELQLTGQPAVRQAAEGLSYCMCAAALILDAAFGTSASEAAAKAHRIVFAMSEAHWQAVQVCVERAPAVLLMQDATLMASLAAMMGAGPAALALSLPVRQQFQQLWCMLMQDASARGRRLRMIVHCGTPGPYLTAFLASGGYWHTLLEEAQVATSEERQEFLESALGIISVVKDAARPLAALEAPASSSDAKLLAQLRQRLASTAIPARPWTVDTVRAALECAQELGDSLIAWWERPSAQQERQLEAAQAAAARSCAYLRCANLGSGGGPAAGQGEGSQRCSACRAVWYCGAACLHADWRAGHKRVCKALGAGRAAAKAARRQVAEAVGEGQAV